eukprot:2118577-Pleurochrysis_carterae.AAC.4
MGYQYDMVQSPSFWVCRLFRQGSKNGIISSIHIWIRRRCSDAHAHAQHPAEEDQSHADRLGHARVRATRGDESHTASEGRDRRWLPRRATSVTR